MTEAEQGVQRDNLKTTIIAAACGIAVIVALSVSGVAFILRFDATNTARANNARVWHAVICQIEQVVIAKKNITVAEKRADLRFYDGLLVNDVHAMPCGLEVKS